MYLPLAQEQQEQEAAQDPDSPFSLEETLLAHSKSLDALKKTNQDMLLWRKVATGATIAGALFAMIRLTDIYFAVKRRRQEP